MGRLLMAILAGILLAPRPAAAAEVAIMGMTDPWSTVVEVFDVRTAPALGAIFGGFTAPPYHPGRIYRSLTLPGNVVSLRLRLRLRWELRPQEYWIECSPSPLDQSVVMVFAGEMPDFAIMPFTAMGRFVGQMGKCRAHRLNR
ncbi:MAG: hypothetical protein H6907_19490 [Hyphomicrobiales bacterium]|nr:hypothetical protein [Hyphomicrobiales bacterium]MCP5373921.1 hypothetical protein [Hyphomicrobiales bacterium]